MTPLIVVEHGFPEGLYTRKMTARKGAFIIGLPHQGRTVNLCMKGRIMVYAAGKLQEISAPWGPIESLPGIRKLGLTMEETVWINIWPNPDNCRDIAELERRHLLPRGDEDVLFLELTGFSHELKKHALQLEAAELEEYSYGRN